MIVQTPTVSFSMNKFLTKVFQKLTQNFIYFIYNWLNIKDFEFRKLTLGEIQIAKSVFQNLIDYDEVKIFNIPYLPWQPKNILMAPNGHLFVNKENFSKDYSRDSVQIQALLIHELTHILQYQRHTNVLMHGLILQSAYYLTFKQYNPYKYNLVKGKVFEQYNIEQQGDIARDIFLKKIPNIIIDS